MRVLRDVLVHRRGPEELVVVSHLPGIAGEEMSLDLSESHGPALRVRVLESRPIVVEGAVRHRIRVGTLEGPSLDGFPHATEAGAVLGRHLTIRLADISRSGCLLLADSRLDEETTGLVRVLFEGVDYADEIRIVRCQAPAAGTSGFRLGAQFLWLNTPGEGSLRRLISALEPRTASAALLGFAVEF